MPRENHRIALLVALTLLTIPLAGPVQAHDGEHPSDETVTLNCGESVNVAIPHAIQLYNENTDSVPDMIGGAIASNTTEFIVTDSNKTFTLQTDNSLKINSYTVSDAANPDVIVKADTDTVCSVTTATDPVAAFNTAYDSGAITIEGTNTADQAKIFVIDKVMELTEFIQ